MRRDADADLGVVRVAGRERRDVRRDPRSSDPSQKRRWSRAGGFSGAGPGVDDAKKRNAQSGVLGGAYHRVAHHQPIVIGRATRLVVHVMKLADGAHARPGELAVSDERDAIDRLRRQRARKGVHRLAPSPKIVGLSRHGALCHDRASLAEMRASGRGQMPADLASNFSALPRAAPLLAAL